MEHPILFKEQQRFNQIWFWILLVAINVFFIGKTTSEFLVGRLNGDNPTLPIPFILTMIFMVAFTILFASFKLHTEIKDDGIYIRFSPFFTKAKKYEWNTINECFVRKYSPIMEYGGWGIRVGIFGKGMAYSTSGNYCIQLVLSNGKKLLIGTQEPDKVKMILQQLEKYKEL